jgi:hypothetical protein
MAVVKRARRILDRYKQMKAQKANWLNLYQTCAEYVMSRKQSFTVDHLQGVPQTDQIFDDTAPNANSLMAAALIGALWPNGAKTFRISMPYGMEEELQGETEEIKRWYQNTTKRMAEFMDNPKSGFTTALEEYMLDQGAFGISGIMVEDQDDDFEVPLAYRAVDAKALHIAEGKNGFVNTIYVEREYTIRQLVEEYGLDEISEKHRKTFLKGEGCDEKVAVLHAIEPRMDVDPYGFGVMNMPFASIHIDIGTEKIMRESGMLELPVAVTRFWKAMGETYGRSPAMNAMPSILEANALGEAWILAIEKTLDPALLVWDDSMMGNGVIDTSPGGINVVSVSGRINTGSSVPIQPLFLVGDLQWTAARRTELNEIIKNHFYQDRLMDLNNEHRMQNPEVQIRNDLRGQTLNTVYSRQMGELFVPVIETTFHKLRRRGFLGVIPGSKEELMLIDKGIIPKYIPEAVIDRMKTGQEIFKIEFISPATRIMQSEELQGIEHLVMTTINAASVNPDVLDIIDWDWTLRRVQELDGSPRETIVSLEKLKKLREQKQAMQQAQMKLEADRQQSETARNMGQAASSAGLTEAA